MDTPIPEGLVRHVRERTLIVVVGEGVSQIASDGKAPTWTRLLESAVEKIGAHRLASDEKWSELARTAVALLKGNPTRDHRPISKGVINYLGWPDGDDWREFLAEEFRGLADAIVDRSSVQAVATLGQPIVTTNYDDILEIVTGLEPVTLGDPQRAMMALLQEQPGILHPLGCWTDPQSVLIDLRFPAVADGYEMPEAGILFVGFGSTKRDPVFRSVLDWLSSVRVGDAGSAVYVLAHNNEVADLAADSTAERPLEIVGFGETSDDLTDFLRELKAIAGGETAAPAETDRRPQSETLDPERLLVLAYRLVLGRYAVPALLEDLDSARYLAALSRCRHAKRDDAASPSAVLEALEAEQGGAKPGPLWLGWMEANHAETLIRLRQRLAS